MTQALESLGDGFPPPASQPIRVGVVGGGRFSSQMHQPSLLWLMEEGWPVRVVGVCEQDPDRLEAMTERFPDAATFGDAQAMFDTGGLDAVLIVTWPPASATLTAAAIDAGLHVFVEKPVAYDAATIEALAARADAAGVRVQVGYNRRHQPLLGRVLDALPEMEPITHVDARFLRASRREAIFYKDILGHPLSALTLLFGALSLERVDGWPSDDPDLPLGLRATMRTATGTSVALEIHRACGRNAETIAVLGQRASAEVGYSIWGAPHDQPRVITWRDNKITHEQVIDIRGNDRQMLWAGGFPLQMGRFLRGVVDGGENRCSLADAVGISQLGGDILAMALASDAAANPATLATSTGDAPGEH